MKLVFLHGAPATGKLTVAKALLNVVPGRLLDNHAAIDFARTIFEFGAARRSARGHYVLLLRSD
jgi:tRNA uridine 5-carbamoylmethylation protein Kti12